MPARSKITSDSPTPLGSARSRRLATGSAAARITAQTSAAPAKRQRPDHQPGGNTAIISGRHAGSALNRSVADPTSNSSAAMRRPQPRRSGIHASNAMTAVSAPAIRQSLSTAPINASGIGNSAPSVSHTASPRRPCRSAQPTSPAIPAQNSPICSASIGIGPSWSRVSCRHSQSIAGGCQSS